MSAQTIQQLLQQHTDQWMDLPGVVGTAIGEFQGRPCIVVLVAAKSQALAAQIPSTVAGYAVIVEETGEFRAR